MNYSHKKRLFKRYTKKRNPNYGFSNSRSKFKLFSYKKNNHLNSYSVPKSSSIQNQLPIKTIYNETEWNQRGTKSFVPFKDNFH